MSTLLFRAGLAFVTVVNFVKCRPHDINEYNSVLTYLRVHKNHKHPSTDKYCAPKTLWRNLQKLCTASQTPILCSAAISFANSMACMMCLLFFQSALPAAERAVVARARATRTAPRGRTDPPQEDLPRVRQGELQPTQVRVATTRFYCAAPAQGVYKQYAAQHCTKNGHLLHYLLLLLVLHCVWQRCLAARCFHLLHCVTQISYYTYVWTRGHQMRHWNSLQLPPGRTSKVLNLLSFPNQPCKLYQCGDTCKFCCR